MLGVRPLLDFNGSGLILRGTALRAERILVKADVPPVLFLFMHCDERDALNLAYTVAIREWFSAGGNDPANVDKIEVINANLKVSATVRALLSHRLKRGC